MKNRILVEVISLSFVFLFVYAAISKISDPEKFEVQLNQSPLLTGFAFWLVWLVPVIEIMLSILLMIPVFRQVALYGSFSLMVMFTGYIVAILNFSYYIPCSCGGILERFGWREHLIFNVGFVTLAIIGVLVNSNQYPVSRTSDNDNLISR